MVPQLSDSRLGLPAEPCVWTVHLSASVCVCVCCCSKIICLQCTGNGATAASVGESSLSLSFALPVRIETLLVPVFSNIYENIICTRQPSAGEEQQEEEAAAGGGGAAVKTTCVVGCVVHTVCVGVSVREPLWLAYKFLFDYGITMYTHTHSCIFICTSIASVFCWHGEAACCK